MNKRSIYQATLLAFGIGLTALPASATTSTVYDYRANYNNNGITSAHFAYIEDSQTLNVAFTADPAKANFGGTWDGHSLVDGFWLVLSDGPNPQNDAKHDSAILYGDLKNNTISSFVYTDVSDSYQNPLIQKYEGALNITTVGTSTDISFGIDVGNINSYSSALTSNDWNGISFGKQIGTWLHPSFNSNIGYDKNGVLNHFLWSGWIGGDENYRQTTVLEFPHEKPQPPSEIPEPATATLMLLGLGAAAARSKKTA